MRKILFMVTSFLVMSSLALAQDDQRAEFFIGYSNLQAEGLPDRNDANFPFDDDFFKRRTTLHGVNASITGFPTKRFGLTGDFSFNRKERTSTVINGRNFIKNDTYYFMGGPSVKFRNMGRVEPFMRVMAGGAHTRFEVSSRRDLTTGTVNSSFDVGTTDFAMGAGGGLDIRLGDKFSLRLIQIDYTPIFLRDKSISVLGQAGALQPFTLQGQRQDNVRFSAGLVF